MPVDPSPVQTSHSRANDCIGYHNKQDDDDNGFSRISTDGLLDRDACKRLIADAGLPVPVKSACFFCPASKRHEVVQLKTCSSDLHRAALVLEDRYRNGKHYRRDDSKAVQGLGIRRTWAEMLN